MQHKTRYPKPHKHYSYREILSQIAKLKKVFQCDNFSTKNSCVFLTVKLQPTEYSDVYTVRIVAQCGKVAVKVYVIEPKIRYFHKGKMVPHIYPDGSLCLYYPANNEWNYADSWADTIIPWTSLWLYYYEIWLQTGEWLGGGIHIESAERE